jgi:drug/metabolite transporter (DMT)-like permease
LARHPRARLVVLGGLIAGFLVGRPYPLFFKLLGYAVRSHNPLYGALVFVLQSLGNVLVMGVLAVLLTLLVGNTGARWLGERRRSAAIAGVALVVLGVFLVFYWDVRLPSLFGYGWFPTAPWNS